MAGRHQLLILITLLSVLVGGLHLLAIQFSLYWLFLWFDMVLHFLGGALVGVVAVYLWLFWNYGTEKFYPKGRYILWVVFFSALGVGIAWEVFEYFNNLIDPEYYALDTSIDIVMDLLGSVTVYWAFVHSRFSSMLQ